MVAQEYTKPTSILDCAVRLSELGYFPVPIPIGCKGPTLQGWDKLRLRPEECADHFAETGMLIGILHTNVLALDIDVYDEALAHSIVEEALRRFPGALERIGEAPKSALFFRMDEPGFKIGNTEKHEKDGKSAQVEVRSVSRQIVVYGKHPTTHAPYTWPRGELWATPREALPNADRAEIERFRDWCNDRIRKWAGVEDARVAKFDLYPPKQDDRPSAKAFREALRHVPASVGYDDWLRGLMAIHDFYSGSAEGLGVAQEWSAPYADYNPREVESKWRSFEVGKGVSYKSIFHLAKLNGADMAAISRIDRPQRPDSFTFNQGADAGQEKVETAQTITDFPIDDSASFLSDLRPLEYLIDGLLPVGVAYSLTGYAGHGKTTLALQFAISVARGELFADRTTSKGRVLIMAGENPYNVKWQYAAALAARNLRPEDVDIHFIQGRFSIKKWGDVLRAKMAQMPDLKLVIVDSLQAFFEGDNDNDNTQMVEMAHSLRGIANVAQRPAILIIAHPAGKVPSKENLVPRGGGAFLAEIDGNLTVWSQDASQQTLHHSQKFRGASFDPIEWVMQVHEFPHLTDVHGTPLKLPVSRPEMSFEASTREAKADTLLRQYLDAVQAGKAPSVREAATRFAVSRWRMQQVIETAKSEKLIRRHAKTWVITQGGEDFLGGQNAGL